MSLIITWQTLACKPKAEVLAKTLNLPLAEFPQSLDYSSIDCTLHPIVLNVAEDRVALIIREGKITHTLFTEFLKGPFGYRFRKGEGKRQAIAKAVGLKAGVKELTVLDTTAGLGRDAFILASLGCKVLLVERSPIIGALLLDGLSRASQDKKGARVVESMEVVIQDAKKVLEAITLDDYPDVVYLDPMFPHEDKNALNKIDMRLIRQVVGDDEDADVLLPLALSKARKRVVVKRTQHAPVLAGCMPSFVVKGKSNRYDIYLTGGHS